MESKHRFPQSLENAHAFPTFPPPDDDHTYSKREKIIVPERVKYLTPITTHAKKEQTLKQHTHLFTGVGQKQGRRS
jgi:hypothetical protein